MYIRSNAVATPTYDNNISLLYPNDYNYDICGEELTSASDFHHQPYDDAQWLTSLLGLPNA